MSRKAFHAVVTATAAAVLLGAACGNGDRRATPAPSPTDDPSAEAALTASRERFGQAGSFRTRFAVEAEGLDGRIEGEAGYQSRNVVYAQTAFFGGQPADDDVTALLFLPPDLYIQQGDGGWLVQSPWNQGIRPGEERSIGLDKPIIEYEELARGLHDVERRPDEYLDGRAAGRYRGQINLADLPSLAPDGANGTVASVDLWLDRDSGLPAKVEVQAGSRNGFHVTIEFQDYDQPLSPPLAPADARPLRDAQFPDAPCTGSELAACLEVQSDIRGYDACDGTGKRVCLVPLGRVSPDLVDHLVAYYRDQYGLSVTVLAPAAIPARLEDPLRDQVDAAGLIDYMGSLFPDAYRDPQAVLVGITVVDLYDSTSHFRYVFGVKGTPSDPKAVVSTFRMNPLFYSEPPDEQLLYSRTRKLLSKYIGLLYYGLATSPDPESPMFDSILGPEDVDRMKEPLPVTPSR